MTSQAGDALCVQMPGAFARLGPELADVYVSASTLWLRRLQRAGRVRHWSTARGEPFMRFLLGPRGVSQLRAAGCLHSRGEQFDE